MIKKVILIFQILTVLIFANEKITLQLQWKHQFEFAGFYAAKEQGFYDEVGLEVDFKEFQSNMHIVEEVLSNKAHYGLTYSTLVADYMQGKPLVFVANFFKQSPLVLVTQTDIKTPADLREKRIMGLLDSTHKDVVLTMLDKFNITPKDFINIPRKFSIESFKNKEVDAISVFITNEIYALDNLGIKYNILDPAAYGTKFYDLNLFTTKNELINHPLRVEKFKQASIKGWKYALKHKIEIVNLILTKYNTQNKTKEALLFEANQIEYLMLTNVYPIGSIDLTRVQTIADSYTQTHFLPKKSKQYLSDFIYQKEDKTLNLNQIQEQYLKNKKILKLCVDPNWMPLDKIEGGKHIGVASDVISHISNIIDTPIKLVKSNIWSDSLEKIKNKECDLLSLAEETPLRKKYLNFTTAYLKLPFVIATKVGVPFSSNLNSIKEKTFGVVRDYSSYELLKNKYPHIDLIEVDSIQEGLSFVDQEKIFGFIDNAMVINHEIQKNNMGDNINITGQFTESYNLSIASRNDEPLLDEVLQKALTSINHNTIDNIVNKWTNINYQVRTDYKILVQLFFFASILVSFFIYWNLKLKEEIKNKELVQKQLKESEEKFRTLFDIAPVFLNAFNEDGKVMLWNKECQKVFGWSFEEVLKSDDPLKLFYQEPKIYDQVKKSLKNKSYNTFQEWHPLTKSGKKLVTMWVNIELPNGEIVNIGYDITKYRENELALQKNSQQLRIAKEELEKLNNSLEEKIELEIIKNTKHQMILMHQNKLVQMGEMIENIAHQWRQPLSQINSSVLLIDVNMTKNNISNEIIEEKLLEIESLTSYMSKTIDDFKNFFHPDKQKSVFSIETAVLKSYDILKGSMKVHQITLEMDIPRDLEYCSHLEELQQVFLIILNNAIDALSAIKKENSRVVITSYKQNDIIIITIQDNANGIEENFLDKIFDPYFTTKHKSQGTGLGLYMAKMLVENGLGGTLEVQNKYDGACFKMTLPLGDEE